MSTIMARTGYFDVTVELMAQPFYPSLLKKIEERVRIIAQEERPHGIRRMHCESEYFDEVPEGFSAQYEATVTNTTSSNTFYIEFKKVQ